VSRQAGEALPRRATRAGTQTSAELADGLELLAGLIRAGRPGATALAATLLDGLRQPSASTSYVDAASVARHLGVSAEWVRDRGLELGGERVGTGPRPRWRFDLELALERATACDSTRRSGSTASPAATGDPRTRRRRRTGTSPGSAPKRGVELMPIRGEAPCP
jgi:hypothetical protein